jgi:hypothetical protein
MSLDQLKVDVEKRDEENKKRLGQLEAEKMQLARRLIK